MMDNNLLFVPLWCVFACVFVAAAVAGPAGGGGEAGGSYSCQTTRGRGGKVQEGAGERGHHQVTAERKGKVKLYSIYGL